MLTMLRKAVCIWPIVSSEVRSAIPVHPAPEMLCEDAHIRRASSSTVWACTSKRPAMSRINCGSVIKREAMMVSPVLYEGLLLVDVGVKRCCVCGYPFGCCQPPAAVRGITGWGSGRKPNRGATSALPRAPIPEPASGTPPSVPPGPALAAAPLALVNVAVGEETAGVVVPQVAGAERPPIGTARPRPAVTPLAPAPVDPADPATPGSEPSPLAPGSSASVPPSVTLPADWAAGLIEPDDTPSEATDLNSDPPLLAGDINPLALEITSDGEPACSPEEPRLASAACTLPATDDPSDWATAPVWPATPAGLVFCCGGLNGVAAAVAAADAPA